MAEPARPRLHGPVDGVATPLVGAQSDRTTDARAVGKLRGRRHRWAFGMAILSAICLVLISQQVTVIGVLGLWALFSVFQNGQYASLRASIPDHVPVRQRATVAGWVGCRRPWVWLSV